MFNLSEQQQRLLLTYYDQNVMLIMCFHLQDLCEQPFMHQLYRHITSTIIRLMLLSRQLLYLIIHLNVHIVNSLAIIVKIKILAYHVQLIRYYLITIAFALQLNILTKMEFVKVYFYCHQLCTTCNGPQDNQCLTCNSVRTLTQQNQCLCYKGYYSLDNQCLKCSYYCQECDQDTICLSCPLNRYLNELNICVCSQGYYNKDNQQSCEFCPNNCESCINFSQCLQCKINHTLFAGKCFCSEGFFEESGSCLSCNSQVGKFQKSCNYKNCNDNIWTPSEECDDGNKTKQ
ncbi:peptidase S8-like protein [Paramecium bursaria]